MKLLLYLFQGINQGVILILFYEFEAGSHDSFQCIKILK